MPFEGRISNPWKKGHKRKHRVLILSPGVVFVSSVLCRLNMFQHPDYPLSLGTALWQVPWTNGGHCGFTGARNKFQVWSNTKYSSLPSVSLNDPFLFEKNTMSLSPSNQCSQCSNIWCSFYSSSLSLLSPQSRRGQTAHILSWQGKILANQNHFTGQSVIRRIMDGLDKRTRPRSRKGTW